MTERHRFTVSLAIASLLTGAVGLGLIACGSDDSSGSPGSGGVATGGAAGALTGGTGGTLTGGSGGTLTGGAGGIAGASGSGGGIAAEYPAGPYGNEVGDTIANLAWEGYVNDTGGVSSDTLPYVDYGTDAMRKSGKAYGLIHISALT